MALGFIHPFTLALMGIMAIGFPICHRRGAPAGHPGGAARAAHLAPRAVSWCSRWSGAACPWPCCSPSSWARTSSARRWRACRTSWTSANMPLVWLMGWLLFAGVHGHRRSRPPCSFDRSTPALGVTLVFVLVNYLRTSSARCGPMPRWLRTCRCSTTCGPRSCCRASCGSPTWCVLGGVLALALVYAWVVFPRRDIAAPS